MLSLIWSSLPFLGAGEEGKKSYNNTLCIESMCLSFGILQGLIAKNLL